MEPIVHVENFTKVYGDIKVIDSISFKIYPGEIFALLGPNGAGKTTTLECIEGIRKPDGGKILITGANPEKEFKKIRRKLGVQLQASGLPDIITVEEAMKMFSLYAGIETRYDLLERLDLLKQNKTQFCKLSTGQQRKLVLAIALANKPSILILDEPTAGLDVHTRVELHEIMKEERNKGTAILLSSHDMSEVEGLADKVAILLQGKIVAAGTSNEIITSGSRIIKIFVKTMKASISGLKQLPVLKIEHKDEYIIYHCEDIEEVLHKVLFHIRTNGDKLLDLRVERPSLEESFLNITKLGDVI
jgi:ABC-2 type transport system ATP-binding protein